MAFLMHSTGRYNNDGGILRFAFNGSIVIVAIIDKNVHSFAAIHCRNLLIQQFTASCPNLTEVPTTKRRRTSLSFGGTLSGANLLQKLTKMIKHSSALLGYFSPSQVRETVLSPPFHRFKAQQGGRRNLWNSPPVDRLYSGDDGNKRPLSFNGTILWYRTSPLFLLEMAFSVLSDRGRDLSWRDLLRVLPLHRLHLMQW